MKNNKLVIILWLAVSCIWIVLTASRIAAKDSIWIILLNALVALLSLTNVVLNLLKYRKNKNKDFSAVQAVNSANAGNTEKKSVVSLFECYDFNEIWYLVEMSLSVAPFEIDWSGFVVPDKELDSSDWQCPYMEQYLNDTGTEKICDTYDKPENDAKPCRVAFFILKDKATFLRTPYGDFEIKDVKNTPDRLKEIIEFEEID